MYISDGHGVVIIEVTYYAVIEHRATGQWNITKGIVELQLDTHTTL